MRQLLFFITLLLSKVNYCQQLSSYQLKFYTTENGLPSNGIKGLQWDEKSGFLWIATEAGIARFNGIDFKVFSRANMPNSNLERVSVMAGSANGNIFAFDENRHQYNVKENTLHFTTVQGDVLLQKIKETVYPQKIDEKVSNKIISYFEQLKYFRTSKIIIDSDNSCWILDDKGSLSYFPSLQSTSDFFISKENYKSLFAINGNKFLISKSNKITLIEPNFQQKQISILNEDLTPLILPASSKLFWNNNMQHPILMNNNNAWLLYYQNNTIIAKVICNKIPSNVNIAYAQYDNNGKNLFIGTDSKGIAIIKENKIYSAKSNNSTHNNRTAYYAQIKLDSNSILTNESHVVSASNKKINTPFNEPFGFRTSITSDSIVWLKKQSSTQKNSVLFNYNSITKKTKEFSKITITESANVCKLGEVYYIATALGVGKIVADSILYLTKYPSSLKTGNDAFDLNIFDSTSLIYATCKNIIKFNTQTHQLDTLFTINDYCIRTLQKYNNYYLAGTYGGGYYIYKDGVAKQMPLDKNKFLQYTHCFIIDNNGYCWLSCNRGLFKAKIDDIINCYTTNNSFVYYHYFGKNDGMDITELNGGCSPCAMQLNTNVLSFPSMDGLLWAKPNNTNLQLPDGNVYIDNFTVNNKIFLLTDSPNIVLPQNTKSITIELGYTAWCNKENIYIYYRLNKNDDWTPLDINTENIIKLSNLPPGNYQLQIKKINGFGIDNASYKSLSFTIATPWYKKWWFYILIVASLLSLFYGIYKIRTKNLVIKQQKLEKLIESKTIELQQKNNELEKHNTINSRLISIISHDIVTPLKFLNVAGKNLLEKKSLMSEELKDETVKEITSTSKELQLLSTNILNWIKYQNENRRLVKEEFNVCELVTQVFGVLQSMAHQKKLVLVNDIDSTLVITEYFEPLKILTYNLITNAINFSDKGKITVSDINKDGNLSIAVTDEGIGMTDEQIKNLMANEIIVSSANMDNKKGHGLGYLIIKDLIKMMGATLTIESKKNIGTTVSILLKIT